MLRLFLGELQYLWFIYFFVELVIRLLTKADYLLISVRVELEKQEFKVLVRKISQLFPKDNLHQMQVEIKLYILKLLRKIHWSMIDLRLQKCAGKIIILISKHDQKRHNCSYKIEEKYFVFYLLFCSIQLHSRLLK